jgi:hypothetical protein
MENNEVGGMYSAYEERRLLLLLLFNCNWVDTRWQEYSIHLHTNSTQNTEDGAHITIKRFLVGKPEGKRPFGRPRRRLKDNIKTDLQELRCRNMDWI